MIEYNGKRGVEQGRPTEVCMFFTGICRLGIVRLDPGKSRRALIEICNFSWRLAKGLMVGNLKIGF